MGDYMKRFFSALALLALAGGTYASAQVEIAYTREGGGAQYDAVKFFSEDGKYSSDKPVTIVAFTDKMHPTADEAKANPDGAQSMNGAQKCLLHSGAGTGFWANGGRSADGSKSTFDADGWRNEDIGKMTLQAPNIFSFTFVPQTFYKTTDVVSHYGIVFNDGKDGKAEGKDVGGSDFKLVITNATTSVKEDGQGKAYELSPIYPNPTSSQQITMINYRVLNTTQRVAVKIFDMRGNLVRTLIDEQQAPANYMVYWDKTDAAGNSVPSGSYMYVIEAGQYRNSSTLIVNN
jgi:hypothetical protein